MNDELRTPRLRLLPITFEVADATINDPSRLRSLIGCDISEAWPNDDFADALPFIRADLHKDTSFATWTRTIVHRNDNVLIGDAGFKSLPDDNGSVEIGYGVVPEYRNQGFAEEAVRALIAWAFRDQGVREIVAECRDDNVPSRRVLEKIGMEYTGTQSSAEGPLLKWRLPAAALRPTAM